ncbi:MAG: sigma-54 dependent transcriptional regulator [Porticoccaceae bacterium]|nr:sigma-54 dependent transcriptional regulator [Porticoccaceae bacterium]
MKTLVGRSAEINELRALIKVVGPSDATALILGDSGTGKELVARALHDCSERSVEPFIPVNCGAIPRELLESELFGHRKGAFTGAISDRKGRFELASGGTLFLDEIGDMSMDLQVKLLRVLQERIIDPVGTTQGLAIDVRVIAATHKNIEMLIEKGEFREDLYYRLNVMPIEIKALRERTEDIMPLIEHFAVLHAKRRQKPITFAAGSLELFMRYNWPGNVRELSNLVNRYSALYPGQNVDFRNVPESMLPPGIRLLANTEPGELPTAPPVASGQGAFNFEGCADSDGVGIAPLQGGAATPNSEGDPAALFDETVRVISMAQSWDSFPEQGLPLKQHMVDIERSLIQQALDKAEGNVSKTARLLNVQRTTLIEKINKYGLSSV